MTCINEPSVCHCAHHKHPFYHVCKPHYPGATTHRSHVATKCLLVPPFHSAHIRSHRAFPRSRVPIERSQRSHIRSHVPIERLCVRFNVPIHRFPRAHLAFTWSKFIVPTFPQASCMFLGAINMFPCPQNVKKSSLWDSQKSRNV